MKKLKILMFVKNESRYIEMTVRSLLAQTFTDFDLIISDNHSTDDTALIASSISKEDQRVKVVSPPVPCDMHEHVKYVRQFATAPYVLHVAGHDIYDAHFVERCINVLDSDAGVDVATSDFYHFNSDNKVFKIPNLGFSSKGFSKLTKLTTYLQGTSYDCVNYGVFRTSKILGITTPHVLGCDHLVVAKLLMQGDVHFINEPLVYFRYPENSQDQKRQVSSLGTVDGAKGWRDLMVAVLEIVHENFQGHERRYAKMMVKSIYMTHYLYMAGQLGISVEQAAYIADEVFGE